MKLEIISTGKTVEEAIDAGCKELGVETPVCEMFYHGIRLIEARMFGEV